ncbi:unnamed protein product [Ilex paraguariensis]|uniref:Mitochondrial carrier protein n=1 Tax=Ilex paraguariensis TaxID=185542 RepID=A0ABC8TNV6_9AQUA
MQAAPYKKVRLLQVELLKALQSYRVLWTGLGAQLSRDVPFSAICWSTLERMRRRLLGLVGEEANAASVLGANFSAGFVAGSLAAAATCPLDVAKTRRQIEMRRRLLGLVGEEANAASVLGANFSAGFVAGSLAAAATCPLDVAKTRRQIEKDHARALRMTMRQTLMEGLFTGVGPRVGRAGPSVGIVVSFYEVVTVTIFYTTHYIGENSKRKKSNERSCQGIEDDNETNANGGLDVDLYNELPIILRKPGLFTGVGPRVGRAGPSVGIVVSFYEVVTMLLKDKIGEAAQIHIYCSLQGTSYPNGGRPTSSWFNATMALF